MQGTYGVVKRATVKNKVLCANGRELSAGFVVAIKTVNQTQAADGRTKLSKEEMEALETECHIGLQVRQRVQQIAFVPHCLHQVTFTLGTACR